MHALNICAFLWLAPGAFAEPVKGQVSANTANGYARLIFSFSEETQTSVSLSNAVAVIRFSKPVQIPVDRLPPTAGGYIGAARLDPDGLAVRLALKRKASLNTIAAGEQLFVDLLPEGWVGAPPGLPQSVIDDLTRRARSAEKKVGPRAARPPKGVLPAKVRVATQPTFTRYIFDLPQGASARTETRDAGLSLIFDRKLEFDLTEARSVLPPTVAELRAMPASDGAVVTFGFHGPIQTRSFRDEASFVVDVLSPSLRDGGTLGSEPIVPSTALGRETVPNLQAAAQKPPLGAVPHASKDEGATAPLANTQPAAPARMAEPRVSIVDGTTEPSVALPFGRQTPVTAFRRGETAWLVFDTDVTLDASKLGSELGVVADGNASDPARSVQVIRLHLSAQQQVRATREGTAWRIRLTPSATEPKTLPLLRTDDETGTLELAAHAPQRVHRLMDPDAGDTILAVTSADDDQSRKGRRLAEFHILRSQYGVAIVPAVDEFSVELRPTGVLLRRSAALAVSSSMMEIGDRSTSTASFTLADDTWSCELPVAPDRQEGKLLGEAADAPESERFDARLRLARHHLARGRYAEAKGVLDVAIAQGATRQTPHPGYLMRGVANVFVNRLAQALADLDHPSAKEFDADFARLWRGMTLAKLRRWSDALPEFRSLERRVEALCPALRVIVLREMARSFVETGDLPGATRTLDLIKGAQSGDNDDTTLLSGRLADALGQIDAAIAEYSLAAASGVRPIAAEATLASIAIRSAAHRVAPQDAIAELEALAWTWRGDHLEIATLHRLSGLYIASGRYRDAFHVMRIALAHHPKADLTRTIQDAAAEAFAGLFIGDKEAALPALEALALFYDYRDLTPIGRKGDELIRRLADRLVSVDLLDQAAELLQHQIDHRLQAAARSQVAAHLARVYLLGRKPDRALQVLRATRNAELANELRNERLLLEARALSDVGRPELALEMVAGLTGPVVERLRADILWSAKRWGAAAEQIERLYADRWRSSAPLDQAERRDILRAAVGYVLSEDGLSLDRVAGRYAPKMADSPEAKLFAVLSAKPLRERKDIATLTRGIAEAASLQSFLRDLRAWPSRESPTASAM